MKVQRKAGAGVFQLLTMIEGLSNKVARVGFFPNHKYDDAEKTPVAMVAAQNEFGNPAKRIPPRPFMRPTAESKRTEWQDVARRGARAIARGNATTYSVLDSLGQLAAGDIKKTISQVSSPPLRPATIAARLAKMKDGKTIGKLNKPLVETGLLFNSVTSEVGDK